MSKKATESFSENEVADLEERMADHDASQPSFLEQMIEQAQIGEELVDPNVGKHDDAVLSSVVKEGTEDKPYLTLTWSGLINTEGHSFEHKDRLFLPGSDSHPIQKSQFMAKLKGLGVVKPDFKHVLYFDSSTVSHLEEALSKCVGTNYNITIRKDKRDYYQLTIRK